MKFLSVYGADVDQLKVYKALLGASATEILEMAGVDTKNSGHLSLIDGGPYLHELGIEELGTGDAYVRWTTNGFLIISKDSEGKEYADMETEPPEEGIVSLVGKISGTHLPLGSRFLEPATPLLSEGDEVEHEQKIGEPVDEGFSIGAWASMKGTISSIEDDIVAIAGGAIPQEEAEAETEAEETR